MPMSRPKSPARSCTESRFWRQSGGGEGGGLGGESGGSGRPGAGEGGGPPGGSGSEGGSPGGGGGEGGSRMEHASTCGASPSPSHQPCARRRRTG